MLWRGQVGAELLHDFHPSVPASGLFWTVPVPPENVTFDRDAGTAGLSLTDLAVPDALAGDEAARVPATLTLTMAWSDAAEERAVRDDAIGFAGSYRLCQATIAWSAAVDGFSFVSDPAAEIVLRFAQIGVERTSSITSADENA